MRKSTMNLQDFWERCTVLIYNADTGEEINSDRMLESKDLEVESFDIKTHFEGRFLVIDGIEVVLEKDEDE